MRVNIPPTVAAALLLLVTAAAAYDLRSRRIPNWLTFSGAALGIALNILLRPAAAGLLFSLLGIAAALAVYLPLFALRAAGAGDGKLMAAVGALVGWREWLAIFLFTAILGGLAAIALSLARGRLKRTLWNAGFALSELRRGRAPYLANEELDVRGSRGLRLPHGAVIAAGTLAYCSWRFWAST